MYDRPYFKDEDPAAVRAFMAAHPFVLLTGCDADGRPVATQVPVFTDERDGRLVLTGHLAKASDHHKAFAANPHVLAVFTGAHTYVSASWYTEPHVGSTWNYLSVHARGTIRLFGGDELAAVMRRLSLHFENGDESSPTYFANLPDAYKAQFLPMISGFEIVVTELDHVTKLSQNRDAASFRNIRGKLDAQGGDAAIIAGEMSRREAGLYPEADPEA